FTTPSATNRQSKISEPLSSPTHSFVGPLSSIDAADANALFSDVRLTRNRLVRSLRGPLGRSERRFFSHGHLCGTVGAFLDDVTERARQQGRRQHKVADRS